MANLKDKTQINLTVPEILGCMTGVNLYIANLIGAHKAAERVVKEGEGVEGLSNVKAEMVQMGKCVSYLAKKLPDNLTDIESIREACKINEQNINDYLNIKE